MVMVRGGRSSGSNIRRDSILCDKKNYPCKCIIKPWGKIQKNASLLFEGGIVNILCDQLRLAILDLVFWDLYIF